MHLIIGSAILTLTVLLGGQEPARPAQSSSERMVLTAAQQKAKLELNEAAESYRKSEFPEALQASEAQRRADDLSRKLEEQNTEVDNSTGTRGLPKRKRPYATRP